MLRREVASGVLGGAGGVWGLKNAGGLSTGQRSGLFFVHSDLCRQHGLPLVVPDASGRAGEPADLTSKGQGTDAEGPGRARCMA